MKLAVLSGKGGTGKTFVSVNLAATYQNATYVDCDVEEPNGRLFLKPTEITTVKVTKKIPAFKKETCIGCRKCVENCHFHALVYIRNLPMVFTEICHACSFCSLVCPTGACTETEREVGKLEIGKSGDIPCVTGILNVGEASAVPVIKSALEKANGENVIIDCPPGSSCSVMESIKDADLCCIVAEGTAFGFQNFKTVYELARMLHKKTAVVINKYEEDYLPLTTYCAENGIEIISKIPFRKEIAKAVSEGTVVSRVNRDYHRIFMDLREKLEGLV